VRFKRERISDLNYLRNAIVYIHQNPVKHSFTKEYSTYLHSSFQSLTSSKDSLLKRIEVIELFGDPENFISVHQQSLIHGEFEDFD